MAGQLLDQLDIRSREAAASLFGRGKLDAAASKPRHNARNGCPVDIPPRGKFGCCPKDSARVAHVTSLRRRWQNPAGSCYCGGVPGQSFPHTDDDLVELRRLKDLLPTQTSRASKRTTALIRLCEGRRTSEIQKETGLSRPGIEKIRTQVIEDGLESLIAKIRRTIKPSQRVRPQKRGRPAIPSLAEWAVNQDPREEPVIDLVQLVLNSKASWVVLAMRAEASSSASSRGRTLKALDHSVMEAIVSKEPPRWTGTGFDSDIQFLLWRLRQVYEAMPCDISPAEPNVAKHWKSFGVGWVFYVLHTRQVPSQLLSDPESRIRQAISVESNQFLDRLEQVLYYLRTRENLLGLFPSVHRLQDRVARHSTLLDPKGFTWSVKEADVDDSIRSRIVEFMVYCMEGAAFRLPGRLRKHIAQKGGVPLGSIELRPRIAIQELPLTSKKVTVVYQPIPQVGYTYVIDKARDVASAEQVLRKSIRDRKHKLYLEYSVRLCSRLNASAYPSDLAHGLTMPWGRSVAIVSVPRQWFMEPPGLPMGSCASLVGKVRGVKRIARMQRGKQMRVAVFHASDLLPMIKRAFRENRYGERVARLLQVDDLVRRTTAANTRQISIHSQPPFYFSDDERAGRNVSRQYRARLKAYLGNEAFDQVIGRSGEAGDGRFSYDEFRTFDQLLIDYDADFLLREIDEDAWEELKLFVEQWRQLLEETVTDEYWPGGHANERLILRTVQPSLRKDAVEMMDEVTGWAAEALHGFGNGADRVLRHAVETAQRVALSNRPPLFAVVRTERSILRSWKSYLGQSLGGRIVEESGRRGDEEAALEEKSILEDD